MLEPETMPRFLVYVPSYVDLPNPVVQVKELFWSVWHWTASLGIMIHLVSIANANAHFVCEFSNIFCLLILLLLCLSVLECIIFLIWTKKVAFILEATWYWWYVNKIWGTVLFLPIFMEMLEESLIMPLFFILVCQR